MATAQEILDIYWDGKTPVDVESMADKMGVAIEINSSTDFVGSIELKNSAIVISINSAEKTGRRFAIAHEIGHISLGHLKDGFLPHHDARSSFATGVLSMNEREANLFAAEFLMPELVVRYAIAERGYTRLESLAQLFGVSQVAMCWRLKQLGI